MTERQDRAHDLQIDQHEARYGKPRLEIDGVQMDFPDLGEAGRGRVYLVKTPRTTLADAISESAKVIMRESRRKK